MSIPSGAGPVASICTPETERAEFFYRDTLGLRVAPDGRVTW